jgi:hypothetical protein
MVSLRRIAVSRKTGIILCGVSQNGTPHRPAPLRPCVSPLFSTLSAKPYISAPLSNSFRFNQFQTPKKAPLCKSFRIIAFQNLFIFSGSSTFNLELSTLDNSPNPPVFSITYGFSSRMPPKRPNVFYHLQTATHVTTSVFYHLQKRRGVGWRVIGTDRSHP